MVSVAYLISVLFALISFSRAEEVANGRGEKLEARWFGGGGLGMGMGMSFYNGFNININPWILNWINPLGGCYGYGLFGGGMMNGMLFVKATDNADSISRRAISLDADQLHRRGHDEQHVNCVNAKGETAQFLKSDCNKAANQLSEKKLSTASFQSCQVSLTSSFRSIDQAITLAHMTVSLNSQLSLVSPKDRVAPKQITGPELEKAVDGIMKACSARRSAKPAERAPDAKHFDSVALVLSKPHN